MTRPASIEEARSIISGLVTSGILSIDPERIVCECLRQDERILGVDSGAGIVVTSIGKAATPMARGARAVLGSRIQAGIILTKDEHAANAPSGFDVFEASHPVPDRRGLEATKAILGAVSGLEQGDIVLALISGGGSALLELPRKPLTLDDIQATTRLLLRAGAPIQDLNAVRSELSQVKGGGLRRHMNRAKCVTLILSDVLSNDAQIVASGPTVRRNPAPDRALTLLDQYGIMAMVPPSVVKVLQQGVDDSAMNVDLRDDDVFRILADNDGFIDRINARAIQDGLRTAIVWRRQEGEARNLAVEFVRVLGTQDDDVDVVLGGGEATVTVSGEGTGGRNTEFVLAAALALEELPDGERWVVASIASDGQDGSVDAAGAISSADRIREAIQGGLEPEAALAANDSGGFFDQTGDLIRLGPTGTNVNDVYLAIRLGHSE